MTYTPSLDAEGFTRTVRAGMVRTVAAERAPDVYPHREELAHLLERAEESDREAIRRRAFFNALALAAYAGRRPEP